MEVEKYRLCAALHLCNKKFDFVEDVHLLVPRNIFPSSPVLNVFIIFYCIVISQCYICLLPLVLFVLSISKFICCSPSLHFPVFLYYYPMKEYNGKWISCP